MAESTITNNASANIESFTVTAATTSFVIDSNICYKMGKLAILAVTGHATSNINNSSIINFPQGINSKSYGIIFASGKGSRWAINGYAYTYLGTNAITASLNSGDYIHINVAFFLA